MTKMKLRTTAVYYIMFHVSAVQFNHREREKREREREQMKERKKKATYGREKNGEIST